MMPRIEAGETLDRLHTQALGLAAGDATWKQEAVAKLQAQARGEKPAAENPCKASMDDLAAMGIGMTIVGADDHG